MLQNVISPLKFYNANKQVKNPKKSYSKEMFTFYTQSSLL